jgi:hypothetical protein
LIDTSVSTLSKKVTQGTYDARYHDDVIVDAAAVLSVRGEANVDVTTIGVSNITRYVCIRRCQINRESIATNYIGGFLIGIRSVVRHGVSARGAAG